MRHLHRPTAVLLTLVSSTAALCLPIARRARPFSLASARRATSSDAPQRARGLTNRQQAEFAGVPDGDDDDAAAGDVRLRVPRELLEQLPPSARREAVADAAEGDDHDAAVVEIAPGSAAEAHLLDALRSRLDASGRATVTSSRLGHTRQILPSVNSRLYYISRIAARARRLRRPRDGSGIVIRTHTHNTHTHTHTP